MGKSRTVGFGNMTIPKSAVRYGSTPIIYIDNQAALNQGFTQDTNNYYVWYTIHFSIHQVSVVFAQSGFQNTVFLGLDWVQLGILVLMSVVVAVVIVATFIFLSKKGAEK